VLVRGKERHVLRGIFAIFVAFLIGTAPSLADQRVMLARSAVLLNGPWQFHTGDDPAWKKPSLDDSKWESVNLAPLAGAHDGDVGLTNYVAGWAARAHKGYKGFAWYRLTVNVKSLSDKEFALVGPADVDTVYQIYFNGRFIGSDGDFSRSPPTVISVQPHLFPLPRADWSVSGDEWRGVIAIRVWCRAAPPPDAGGIHIAPWLGTAQGASAQYHLQWIEKFDGYVVDATEGLGFLLLAVMALSLVPFDRTDSFYRWLAAGLVLLAAVRGNQAVYFWSQSETLTEYIIVHYVLGDPLLLGLWTMTWRACFGLRNERWTAAATLALTAICMLGQILSLSMLTGVVPHLLAVTAAYALAWGRLAFLLLFAGFFIRGLRSRGRSDWLALFVMLLLLVGLYATELSGIGIPGIWFPFGVGVSRTEYAYAALDVVLFMYLLQRLWRYAPRGSVTPAV
jgi:hypothetical protein